MRLPVVGCFLGLREMPRQRQMDRVEGLLDQGGRFRRRRYNAEAAAKRRFKARLPLSANVEHLIDVSVDETVSDLISGIQGGLRLPVDFIRLRKAMAGPSDGRPSEFPVEERGGFAGRPFASRTLDIAVDLPCRCTNSTRSW